MSVSLAASVLPSQQPSNLTLIVKLLNCGKGELLRRILIFLEESQILKFGRMSRQMIGVTSQAIYEQLQIRKVLVFRDFLFYPPFIKRFVLGQDPMQVISNSKVCF